jgi:hypothetical protein
MYRIHARKQTAMAIVAIQKGDWFTAMVRATKAAHYGRLAMSWLAP